MSKAATTPQRDERAVEIRRKLQKYQYNPVVITDEDKQDPVVISDEDEQDPVVISEVGRSKTERVLKIRKKIEKFRLEPEVTSDTDERVVEVLDVEDAVSKAATTPQRDERAVVIRRKLQKYQYNPVVITDEDKQDSVVISDEDEQDPVVISDEDAQGPVVISDDDERAVEVQKKNGEDERVFFYADDRKNEDQKWKEVFININNGDPEEVIGKGKFKLKRDDLRTLAGTNYLNNQVMEEYFDLIKERNEADQSLPKIEVLSTFVFTKLDSLGFEAGFNDIQ